MPALKVTYGEARRGELPQLVALLGVLFDQEAEFTPAPAKQRRALGLILGDRSRGRIYVARRGKKLLAMLSVQRGVSTAEGGPSGWLEDLVVRPQARGEGTGSALLAFAIERSRADGLLRLTLLTDAANRRAQALYRRAGFVPSSMRPMRLLIRRAVRRAG